MLVGLLVVKSIPQYIAEPVFRNPIAEVSFRNTLRKMKHTKCIKTRFILKSVYI